MPSRLVTDLDPRILAPAQEVIRYFYEATGKSLSIVDTLRTQAEQDAALASGHSWTTHSKHLPQPPLNKSLALDVCPVVYFTYKNWNPTGSLWWVLAEIVIHHPAGLISGMDWNRVGLPAVGKPRPKWDPGHIEKII